MQQPLEMSAMPPRMHIQEERKVPKFLMNQNP
jgi:hypothetical protein